MTTPPYYSDSIVEVRFNVKSKQPNNTKDIWHLYKCSNMFNEWFWRSSVVGRGLFTSFYPLVESNSRRTRVTFFSILFLHVTLLFQKDLLTKLFYSLKLHFILKIIHSYTLFYFIIILKWSAVRSIMLRALVYYCDRLTQMKIQYTGHKWVRYRLIIMI